MQMFADRKSNMAGSGISSVDRAKAFCAAEDGNLTIFGLMMASLMIAFGGLAVDMMRYEATRAALQNTLDRSALAAASFSQTMDSEAVVTDYFEKAGLSDQLVGVTATEGLNFRRVEANAEADTVPFFLNMVGLKQLHVAASSAAEQRITNVEVMLVLDVSGSMGNNNKLTNLQAAATEFVDTVLENDVENKISIGIVPFNNNVNLGPDLIGAFNATHDHGVANINCVDLPTAAFDSAIPLTLALPMTSIADASSSSSSSGWTTSNRAPATSMPGCDDNIDTIVRLPDQDIVNLQGQINGLDANGYTSINVGMSWGYTLLDPTLRDAYTDFIADAKMPADTEGRPFDFDDKEAMKVIVLMTDGENTSYKVVHDAYKTGPSPIWKATDGYYSIFHASKVLDTNASTICASRPYWVPHLSTWQALPWTGVAPTGSECYEPTPATPYPDTTMQNWEAIWQVMRVNYVTSQFYARALGGSQSTYNAMFYHSTNTTEMNTQLQSVCNLAKANDVIVYGIAFEAPTNGQTQIRNCSTSDSHYFDASGTQITTAFRSIANNISQLRLTQ